MEYRGKRAAQAAVFLPPNQKNIIMKLEFIEPFGRLYLNVNTDEIVTIPEIREIKQPIYDDADQRRFKSNGGHGKPRKLSTSQRINKMIDTHEKNETSSNSFIEYGTIDEYHKRRQLSWDRKIKELRDF